MAKLVGGMATSHAFALVDPQIWERAIIGNRKFYKTRHGFEPDLDPRAAAETLEDNLVRYQRVIAGHATLRDWLAENVDVLLLLGDDQEEQFGPENTPAIAIYDGGDFDTTDIFNPDAPPIRYPCASSFASYLIEHCTNAGFDISIMHRLQDNELKAHAFGPVLHKLDPSARLKVVPVFVEGVHHPAPTPRRCYQFGQALRKAVEDWGDNVRVAICASGGMSHFSSYFPYSALDHLGGKERHYGSIYEDFDRQTLELIESGKGAQLANLSNLDLLENGGVELRSWIVALGALGDGVRGQVLAYEPFYSCIMGVGIAHWPAAA